MRHIALLLALCTALLSACASEAGNPGPGVNANNWVQQPGPDAGSNDSGNNASTDASNPQPDQVYQGKLPESVEGKYVANEVDNPFKEVIAKREVFENGSFGLQLYFANTGEPASGFKDEQVEFNEPILEFDPGAEFKFTWTKEK